MSFLFPVIVAAVFLPLERLFIQPLKFFPQVMVELLQRKVPLFFEVMEDSFSSMPTAFSILLLYLGFLTFAGIMAV